MDKKMSRLRRARRGRAKIRELGMHRLCIHRTPRHIYAQVLAPDGQSVIAAASTVQVAIKGELKATGNKEAAARVGRAVAEAAAAAGVSQVAFDRSGFRYHGRVQALADAAREHGLQF